MKIEKIRKKKMFLKIVLKLEYFINIYFNYHLLYNKLD